MVLCLVLGLVSWSPEWCAHRCYEPAAVPCNSLYMYDHPWCRISLQQQHHGRDLHRMVDGSTQSSRSQLVQEEVLPVIRSGSCGWFILVLLMEFVLNHTKFGRYTIAIGSNKEAAALSGINVKFYHVMVYVVCGLFVGLAAIAYAAVTPTVQPGTGAGLEMDAIGGVFVGGVAATGGYGSVIGTFVGIFVIMLLKTGLPYIGLQANWQQIITGLVLIVAVLIDIIKEKKKAAM